MSGAVLASGPLVITLTCLAQHIDITKHWR